jgi:hypothetical protein
MFIDRSAILHAVDTATRFSASTFLDKHGYAYGQSVDGVWAAFLECWATVYSGYPNKIRTDAGSIFVSPRWRECTDMAGMLLQISGVESHNSLGLGERMHEPLRRIYRKVSYDFPTAPPAIVLKCATKALNDTMGENGLVPSLLVFGIVPMFPILSSKLPEQQERMRLLAAAQAEYNSIVAERRIAEILKSRVPGAADRVYKVGEEVLVLQEKSESWTRPFIVTGVNDMLVNLRSEELAYEGRFNVAQVKPYLRDMPQTDANTNFSEVLHQMLRDFTTEEGAGLSPSYAVHLTEIIRKGDAREKLFDDAKKKEIAGLIRRGTWEDCPKGGVGAGSKYHDRKVRTVY